MGGLQEGMAFRPVPQGTIAQVEPKPGSPAGRSSPGPGWRAAEKKAPEIEGKKEGQDTR